MGTFAGGRACSFRDQRELHLVVNIPPKILHSRLKKKRGEQADVPGH